MTFHTGLHLHVEEVLVEFMHSQMVIHEASQTMGCFTKKTKKVTALRFRKRRHFEINVQETRTTSVVHKAMLFSLMRSTQVFLSYWKGQTKANE